MADEVYSVLFVESYDYKPCLTAFCGTYSTRAWAEARCAQLVANNTLFKHVCVTAGKLHVFASRIDAAGTSGTLAVVGDPAMV